MAAALVPMTFNRWRLGQGKTQAVANKALWSCAQRVFFAQLSTEK